tara:strand:- start:549 stop:1136 length:588 start_codon:yes stop_codon:yes gene_type:complete
VGSVPKIKERRCVPYSLKDYLIGKCMIYNQKLFNGYSVENNNLVSFKRTGRGVGKPGTRVLKPRKDKDGYVVYSIKDDLGKISMIKQHRMIAEKYIHNPKMYKEVDHINGIRYDNRVENLRWVSHQQNMDNRRLVNRTNTDHMNVSRGTMRGKPYYSYTRTYHGKMYRKSSYHLARVLTFKFITLLRIKSIRDYK